MHTFYIIYLLKKGLPSDVAFIPQLEKATVALNLWDGTGPGLSRDPWNSLASFMSQNTRAMHYASCKQGGISNKPVKKAPTRELGKKVIWMAKEYGSKGAVFSS